MKWARHQGRRSFGYFPCPRKESDQPPGCPRPDLERNLWNVKERNQLPIALGTGTPPRIKMVDIAATRFEHHPRPVARNGAKMCATNR
jgi:hypothetical protein